MADSVNPAVLTVEQAAKVLMAAGSLQAAAEIIRRHIEAGAPIRLTADTAILARGLATSLVAAGLKSSPPPVPGPAGIGWL